MIGTFFTFRFVISFWFYFILISLRINLVLLDFVIPLSRPLLWGNLYSWCWFVFLGCRRISSVFTFILLVCVFFWGGGLCLLILKDINDLWLLITVILLLLVLVVVTVVIVVHTRACAHASVCICTSLLILMIWDYLCLGVVNLFRLHLSF